MSGSRFFLSVSGPAAILTLLLHPTIRQTADLRMSSGAIAANSIVTVAPDVVSTRLNRTYLDLASISASPPRTWAPAVSERRSVGERDVQRVRKPLQEGCERAISSLAGPEARRMVPGRCMA